MTTQTVDSLHIYASTGAGHKSVAVSIRDALAKRTGLNGAVVDFFSLTSPSLSTNWPTWYQRLTTEHLSLYDLGWRISNNEPASVVMTRLLSQAAERNLLNLAITAKPKVVVTTAPGLCRSLATIRRKHGLPFKLVNVVTDLATLHRLWVCQESDLTVAFTAHAYEALSDAGVSRLNTRLCRFPVHADLLHGRFDTLKSRAAVGLEMNRPALLVTGGGAGAGPVQRVARELHRVAPGCQLVIVTGTNHKLRWEMRDLDHGQHSQVLGFTQNMAELIVASDVVLTKAGVATIMEAWALERPVIILEEVGLQEHGNGRFVESMGAGSLLIGGADLRTCLRSALASRPSALDWQRIRNTVLDDGLDVSTAIARLVADQPRGH